MRNKVDACIVKTQESNIKFEENQKKIIFRNPSRLVFLKVDVDGCTITGKDIRCDKLLLSSVEHQEYYVELKGTDVKHAISQIEETIKKLGEFDDCRRAYIISTNVAPAFTTYIQMKAKFFKDKFKASLVVREKQLTVALY